MGGTITDCAVDKPAELTRIELPGRAMLFFIIRAFFDFPTFIEIFSSARLPGIQEKKLSFNMVWNGPPALLIATDGLKRYSQEVGGFFLCLMKFFPDVNEFFAFHVTLSSTELRWCLPAGKNSIRG